MPASLTAARRKALQAQNRAIMELFESRGFEHIRPRILQPADVFLEKSGEDIRSRTFLFTDPDGQQELCLRPDLTVPTCRYHLAVAEDPRREAKYCYRGPAFRFHGVEDPLQADEFEQAGLEWFGYENAAAADAEVLGLALEAVRLAGLSTPRVMTGDPGLLRALLDSIDMPQRWRRRLLMRFRRPEDFRATLHAMASPDDDGRTSASALVDRLAEAVEAGPEEAVALV
ncbi:MAG TPA: ATP phosphoribosyltransferase regulatory subunit, partial [Thermopetrobacter sp.]|nr:ATP phosphoribosyltransferase regulatory subunit [Thermopetrobacter sp.]